MTSTAINVASALDDLCREAQASPAESSPEAGLAVARTLVRLGVRVPLDSVRSPCSCPLACYLLRACRELTDDPQEQGKVYVLVGTNHAMLRWFRDGRRVWEFVPLPPVVRAAVVEVGRLRELGLVEGRSAA